MNNADFTYLRTLLHEKSGLALSEDKGYLVDSRLMPLCRRHHIAGIPDLILKLRTRTAPDLEQAVVEAMTTNETYFFRDRMPFDILRERLLPELVAARAARGRIRIWCAACSTGQEPYSIAMIVRAMASQLAGLKVEIVATDLASSVIERAKAGLYNQFEVQRGLPVKLLLDHFTQVGDHWQIAQNIRETVTFRTLNLLRDFSTLGQFDIVFCRNVLIYFDTATKISVLERLARQVAPDGGLFLGAVETVIGLTSVFAPHPDVRGLYLPAPRDNVVPLRRAQVR